jgi:hypothetical protein
MMELGGRVMRSYRSRQHALFDWLAVASHANRLLKRLRTGKWWEEVPPGRGVEGSCPGGIGDDAPLQYWFRRNRQLGRRSNLPEEGGPRKGCHGVCVSGRVQQSIGSAARRRECFGVSATNLKVTANGTTGGPRKWLPKRRASDSSAIGTDAYQSSRRRCQPKAPPNGWDHEGAGTERDFFFPSAAAAKRLCTFRLGNINPYVRIL